MTPPVTGENPTSCRRIPEKTPLVAGEDCLLWPPSSLTKGQEVKSTSPATSTPQEEANDQMDHDQIQIHHDPSRWLGIWMWLWRCSGGAWRLGLASGLRFSTSRSFWIRFSGRGSGGCGRR
ncbi:hypothetical protein LWI29_017095 [Acer saccharum]|uniref:Uncharacterized protein n=1 Tax=Acer saccharum TaxID=4024 RepID=A0AA39S912_ACESA|nr:hypothetical protein LWI29_017095 [Acer saccharum]